MSPWLPLSRCSSSAASTPSHLPPYHNSRCGKSCPHPPAPNMPTFFYPHLSLGVVLDNILGLLRDVRMIIRESAACFLAACLDIGVQR
ncbi:hypothetical protein C8J57DRAFT_1077521 [Mycena rebaudengoi]|nr:hypothetical protein C8J57DRAFT_1102084 [Mycena rebaudengoi]KAJ7252179.1 hypothetical protein C8J57DRAFT_1077521 [Mycena rebaudengoi]